MLDLGQYLLRFQLLYGVPPRPETEAERAFIVTLRPSDRKRSLGKKKRRPVRGGGPTMLDGMFTCRGGEELSRGTLDVRCELVLNEESLMPQLDWARGGYAYYCSSFLLASR